MKKNGWSGIFTLRLSNVQRISMNQKRYFHTRKLVLVIEGINTGVIFSPEDWG
jgi:hypothetical protein